MNKKAYLERKKLKAEIKAKPVKPTPDEYMKITINSCHKYPLGDGLLSMAMITSLLHRKKKNLKT